MLIKTRKFFLILCLSFVASMSFIAKKLYAAPFRTDTIHVSFEAVPIYDDGDFINNLTSRFFYAGFP